MMQDELGVAERLSHHSRGATDLVRPRVSQVKTSCRAEFADRESGRSAAVDQAYDEYCQLLDAGAAVDEEEFCERFPEIKSSLRRLIQVHQFFAEHPADPQTVPTRWPEPGETFLDFRLVRELGRGAFARVFLATEPKLGNREVAVKVAHRGAGEAETLGRLGHPNVVPVFSVQQDAETGLTAICMPFLGGATLHNVLDRAFAQPGVPAHGRVILEAAQGAAPAGPAPAAARVLRRGAFIDAVLHLGAQLAEALAFVHARGVIHRDLKPSNVLISPDGTPMLLDFNLAQDDGVDNQVGGTIPYMAPEQLRATDIGGAAGGRLLATAVIEPDEASGAPAPKPLDGRADLFSLGVILYELLTGAHPFGPVPLKAPTPEIRKLLLERQRHGPRSLRSLNPGVDRALGRILERCLAHDPDQRPASAADLAADLRRQLSVFHRGRRWVRRRPLVAAGVVLLTLGLGGLGSAFAGTLQAPDGADQGAPQVAPAAPVRAAAPAPLTPEELMNQGWNRYREKNFAGAAENFGEAVKADRNNAAAYFHLGRSHQRLGERDRAAGKDAKPSFLLALANFQQADELAPSGNTKALVAYCLACLDQSQAAVAPGVKAIEIGFANPEVYNNLGWAYQGGGDLDIAEANLNTAKSLNPNLQAAYHNLALVRWRRAQRELKKNPPIAWGHIKEGLEYIHTAIDLGPKTGELYWDAARLYALGSQQDRDLVLKGQEYLKKAVASGLDPKLLQSDAYLQPLLQGGVEELTMLYGRRGAAQPATVRAARLVDPVRDDRN